MLLCFAAAGLLLLLPIAGLAQTPATLDRPREPLVLTGNLLPELLQSPPGHIVAFRYHGGWQQIPVQVDERKVIDFAEVIVGGYYLPYFSLHYCDSETFAGPDPDLSFDADDELALRARDAGDRVLCSEVGEPPGVQAGSGVEIEALDPITGGVGWFYLFTSAGGLSPSAGTPNIQYQFRLLSGDYMTTYIPHGGPNPEDSRVTTAVYSMHFSDRWVRDGLHVFEGGSSGVDILDRHRNIFAPGSCSRSEDTFCIGAGGFIANRTGPVRAIRAYIGANSGPYTERTHWFYESRHDARTTLRLHPIGGIMDLYDLSPAAAGMTFYDPTCLGGIPVDGQSETIPTEAKSWNLYTGPQGTLVSVQFLDTDIPALHQTSWYEDDVRPQGDPCTGDSSLYGCSGLWVDSALPWTDPDMAGGRMNGWRVDTFAGPGAAPSLGTAREAEARNPVETSAAGWSCAPPCDPALIGAITDFRAEILGADLRFTWSPDAESTGYDVWVSDLASQIPQLHEGGLGAVAGTCHEIPQTDCLLVGEAEFSSPGIHYYQVIGECDGVEGPP